MLSSFLLLGPLPEQAETGTYVPFLVLLAYVVGSLGSYIALTLAILTAEVKTPGKRRLMLAGGAVALGGGIWSLHFIGMLSYKMTMVISYDPWLTLLSMVIAIGIAYAVLLIVRTNRFTPLRMTGAALLLAIAICAMHYTGMQAMRMDAALLYRPDLFALSFAVAAVASYGALFIVFYLSTHKKTGKNLWQRVDIRRVAGALVMGAAICGMHYTGMEATVIEPFATCRHDPQQSFDSLAFVIALVTSIIFAASVSIALYAREKEIHDANRKHIFPARLLVISLLLTLATTLWAGGNGLYVNFVLKNRIQDGVLLNKSANQLGFLHEEILRISEAVIANYDAFLVEQWREDVRRRHDIYAMMNNETDRAFATAVEKAAFVMESIESRAFYLSQDGNHAAAHELLQSPTFKNATQNYTDGTQKLVLSTANTYEHAMAVFAKSVAYELYLSFVVIMTLPLVWMFSYRAVRQWRLEMETTRKNLAARELELQRFIGEIEMSQTAEMKARQAAERANAAKSDFLANMSHEIRTPMNGLLGMTQLLLGTEMTAEQRSWAEVIMSSGENLLGIINNILDFSKIEAGRLKLECVPFDLYAAMAEVTDLLILRAHEKRIALQVRIAPDTPRFLMGDVTRIKQIIMNLLGNAIKFTAQGHVLLDLRGNLNDDDDARIYFRIEDTGIGIPQSKVAYVFEKFSQAEESTTRRFGGSGLGLAICQRLAGIMGGKIEVESLEGEGSTFKFDIALPPAVYRPVTRVPAADLSGLGALLLCDNDSERKAIRFYLENLGMRCRNCAAAEDLIKELRQASEEKAPIQFVIVDYNVSAQKILEVVTRARIYPELQDVMFIAIAVFGSATSSYVLNSTEISALLTKPLFPDQLQDALRILWDARNKGAKPGLVTRGMITQMQNSAPKEAPITSFHGCRTLVVEDIKVNQMLMDKILEKLGCEREFAVHGGEAVTKVAASTYDIVFMDCQMPVMDGFEATRAIRRAELGTDKHAIIIALTADAMTGDREKCINAGMDDYLNKPFKPEQITAMLKKWINDR